MRIITRKEAVKQGDIFYFTGKECKHGHTTPRKVLGGGCRECKALNAEAIGKKYFRWWEVEHSDNKSPDEVFTLFYGAKMDIIGSKIALKGDYSMQNKNEITIEELLKDTTPEMKELLLKRAIEHHQEEGQGNDKDFEAYLNYAKDNYASRVNAVNLLSLERGLLENLQRVQAALSNQWSAEDTRTVREVLENE